MPTNAQTLVSEARRLARLQARRARLRRDLRAVETEMRQARRNVRKLSALVEHRADFEAPTPPLREFGE